MSDTPPAWLRASSRVIRTVVHVKRRRSPTLPTPAEVLGAEGVDLSSDDHPRLQGWWLPVDGPSRHAVVLVHGFGAGATHMVDIAAGMTALGFPTLLMDDAAIPGPPRRGESGPPRRPGAALEHVLAWLTARPSVDGMVIIGHSMGGSAALGAAVGRSDVRAIVTLGAVADPTRTSMAGIPEVLNRRAVEVMQRRTGLDLRSGVGAGAISRLKVPVLVVHGAADRTVPPFNADALVAAGRTSERLILSGVAHRPAALYAAGRHHIDGFLVRHAGDR